MTGRVTPRQFLDGIGQYLDLEAPERKDELIKAVRVRAEELIDAGQDMVVDEPSKGALAISAVALASRAWAQVTGNRHESARSGPECRKRAARTRVRRERHSMTAAVEPLR
jgi:hypothetical protein